MVTKKACVVETIRFNGVVAVVTLMENFSEKLVHLFPMLQINSSFAVEKAPDSRGLFYAIAPPARDRLSITVAGSPNILRSHDQIPLGQSLKFSLYRPHSL
ncbi:hypothetical protein A3849_06330 [Paenibacillus sp. P46E]|nr:hypothetical protein A3849_06330 [Paenibacillus sp. P46E]